MNDNFHNSIHQAGEDIFLSHEERERMRRTIHAYMEMKPLRATVSPAPLTGGWLFTIRPVAAAMVLALFISSAGISYAAESALPGDLLYPIKTQVNEPVQGALAMSAPAKARWAVRVANERLKEAAILAAEGQLNSATARQLQASFEAHVQEALLHLEEEASSSPEAGAQAAVRFDAQLSAYQQILAQISATTDASTSLLQSSIIHGQEDVSSMQAFGQGIAASSASSTADVAVVASQTRDVAMKRLAESLQSARDVVGALSSSSAISVALGLQDASATISSGDDLLRKNAAPQALGAFQSALGDTERLGVFLQTSDAIHKRTGLVIGVPSQASSTSHQRYPAEDRRGGDGGHARDTGLWAAPNAPKQPSATVSGRTTVQGTVGSMTTSSNDSAADSQPGIESEGNDGAEKTHTNSSPPSQRILPISVPLPGI